MNNQRGLELKVGVLVVLGTIAAIVMILLSERISFEDSYEVTAFLPDAGGLLVGSPVTLSGFRIGSVTHIEPSTDTRGPIRARMTIRSKHILYEGHVVTLASNGVLGDALLAFATSDAELGTPLAQDGTAEVEAQPGLFGQLTEQVQGLMDSASDLMNEESRSDIKRLLKGAADIAEEGSLLITEARTKLAHVDHLASRIDTLVTTTTTAIADLQTKAGDGIVEAQATLKAVQAELAALTPKVKTATDELTKTLGAGRTLAERADSMLATVGPDVTATVTSAKTMAADLAAISQQIRSGGGLVGRLIGDEQLAKDLDDIAVNLSQAAEQIADTPSVLVWGYTPEEQAALERQRQNLRRRRAFMEGTMPPPPDAPYEPVFPPPSHMTP